MKTVKKILIVAAMSAIAFLLLGGTLCAFVILSRKPLKAVQSTTHPTIGRKACIDCHAPIAEEWRQSMHYKSLTGPYWKDVRELGYLKVFDKTRKACVDCHAPANVLDLAVASVPSARLGVECSPTLMREPQGIIPVARVDDADLGVDCTSCHVSKRGIVGSGRRANSAHETLADARFQTAAATVDRLCRTCHSAAVEAWKRSPLPAAGVSCLDCHMPIVTAPSVAGGPDRRRRSHQFLADKDPAMLSKSVNASLKISGGKARFQITNDRVGHYFPSGGNWLTVTFRAIDGTGREVAKEMTAFGRDEPLLLDFWPFNADHRIAFGEHKEILFPLPQGHGRIEAVVRYHDWMQDKKDLLTLTERY